MGDLAMVEPDQVFKSWPVYALFGSILLVMGLIVGVMISDQKDLPQSHDSIDVERSVSGTGSMLPVVSPDVILQTETIDIHDKIYCGWSYIICNDPPNCHNTTVHRFVYEDKKGNIYTKGDNNRYWDNPINRSQLIERVIGYRYED